MPHTYETDGAAIYRKSFATIRAEADLGRFTAEEEIVVVRMIHAAGMVGLEQYVRFSPGMALAARAALEAGAPILCDARMVSEGITRPRLPANNEVICTLHDAGVPELALKLGNTRSAAAVETVAAASQRRGRRHRQCADRLVSPAQHAGRPELPAPGRHCRLPRGFRRRR